MSEHDEFEPDHTSSPTDHVLTELQLYGFHPREDEPDPRPIPEDRVIAGAVALGVCVVLLLFVATIK